MTISHRAKIVLLVIGDIAALYAALFLTVFLRYRSAWHAEFASKHVVPFSIIFVFWIVLFYVSGLYDLRKLRNNFEFVKMLGLTLAVNAGFAIIFFYLVPIFGITPKTNLFIFLGIFAIVGFTWRQAFNRATALSQPLAHLTLIGESPAMQELYDFLNANPQFGYTVHAWLKNDVFEKGDAGIAELQAAIHDSPTEMIVTLRELKRDPRIAKALYALFSSGRSIHDLISFYEDVFRKIPTSIISEEWFLDHLAGHHRFYDGLKRAWEAIFSLLLIIILSPLLLLIALLVKLTSKGPVIYSQVRVGKGGEPFTLYKFRSMRTDAEKHGAQWATHDDKRSTPIGNILRKSHLDELPQLVNILKGELSFVGPRPERPEFVEKLERDVPYYRIRLIVKPGVTGWAQLHYHKDQTVDDVAEKLRYDIYYLKNRSLIIDIAIVIKTIKTLLATPQ